MVYARVQRASAWSNSHSDKSEVNVQPQKIQREAASVQKPSAKDRFDSLPDVPANWMSLDPVMRRIQAKAASMEFTSKQEIEPAANESAALYANAVQMKCSKCEEETDNTSHKSIQHKANGRVPSKSIQLLAAQGFSGSATALPHLNLIQRSFGINLSHVQAYIGGAAAAACDQMGAAAYASGNQIAFKEAPSLELAAHEAAHVVQQQSGKVQLAGGVGKVGDEYEQHADAVAAKVVSGESAQRLLAKYAAPFLENVKGDPSDILQGKNIQVYNREFTQDANKLLSSTSYQAEPNQYQLQQKESFTEDKAQRQSLIQDFQLAQLQLPSLPSIIPGFVLKRLGGRVSEKLLWQAFWEVVVKRFGIRGGAAATLSAADGPFLVGELVSIGLAAWTIIDIFRFWDELWQQTAEEVTRKPQKKDHPEIPPAIPLPKVRRYPNQTCDDEILDQLQNEKNKICNSIPGQSCSPKKVSPKKLAKRPCSDIRRRIKAMRDCLSIRQRIQDQCFGGKPDQVHEDVIDNVNSGLDACLALEKVNCAPGHPMANL